jgi:hypothetical protein
MAASRDFFHDWTEGELVDPRGHQLLVNEPSSEATVDAWPLRWAHRRVGLFSNRKPNADAILEDIKQGLLEQAPDLTFVHGSKEPLAQDAPSSVLDSFSECDLVILASAECGGCTSWLCRDHISLEKRGIPCLTIATHRFETMARTVLSRGGVTQPHLAIPKHPVSGIPQAQLHGRVQEIMGRLSADVLGTEANTSS